MSSGLPRRRALLPLPATARDRAPSGSWLHVSRRAMGCEVVFTVPDEDGASLADLRAGLDEIEALEQRLSLYRPTSELCQLNATAGTEPVEVSETLAAVLGLALDLAEETADAFDPTRGRRRHLDLDRARRTVRFSAPDVTLDFGAIGKGFALDRAADVLRARGVRRALLTAGTSSVRALGVGPAGGFF